VNLFDFESSTITGLKLWRKYKIIQIPLFDICHWNYNLMAMILEKPKNVENGIHE
jgi:hypothetical protein